MFSGGTEKDQWHEMGYAHILRPVSVFLATCKCVSIFNISFNLFQTNQNFMVDFLTWIWMFLVIRQILCPSKIKYISTIEFYILGIILTSYIMYVSRFFQFWSIKGKEVLRTINKGTIAKYHTHLASQGKFPIWIQSSTVLASKTNTPRMINSSLRK